MLIFKKSSDIIHHINQLKKKRKDIGFVPTMGALHAGHLSLIDTAKKKSNIVVCSIFVNPTQFNEPDDLKKYPRTVEKDTEMLLKVGCDILFLPEAAEIYPVGLDTTVDIDLGHLDKVLEGKHRKGHFAGVMQVVKRLLDIVQPHQLFMGQKDFQQFTIIDHMLKTLNIPTKLVVCPIIREEDGLAMSSRNVLLPEKDRKIVPLIHKTLEYIKKNLSKKTPDEMIKEGLQKLDIPEFEVEYLAIVDGTTLLPVKSFEDSNYIVALTAVRVGDVRLIDNVIIKNK